MKAVILCANFFEDSEVLYPYFRFKEEGIGADIASARICNMSGKHGYELKSTRTFKDVNANDYDILIIPGGKAPESIRLDKDAVNITRHFFENGKIVGAICHGPQVLISAGVLKGKKATCFIGMRDDIIVAGARFEDKEAVVDGNLVTSRCPWDLPAFMRELFKLIKKQDGK